LTLNGHALVSRQAALEYTIVRLVVICDIGRVRGPDATRLLFDNLAALCKQQQAQRKQQVGIACNLARQPAHGANKLGDQLATSLEKGQDLGPVFCDSSPTLYAMQYLVSG
jgi:hypothetical protein